MLSAFTLLLGKKPEEERLFYKRRKHFKKLSGRYEAYKKTITLKVQNRSGLLYVKDENWYEPYSTPLIPNNNDPEVMDFCIITPFGRMDVPFTEHSNGDLTSDWERHLLHKKTIELKED